MSTRISAIKIRISKWYFDIQNHALNVNFDIKNLTFGNIPGAKKKVFDHNTCNMKNSDSPDIKI